jgi:hypothetical protein
MDNMVSIKRSLGELTFSLDAINKWAEISRGAESHGWSKCKFSQDDVIVETNAINIIGLKVTFTGLFIFNRNTFSYNQYPHLVKMEVNYEPTNTQD